MGRPAQRLTLGQALDFGVFAFLPFSLGPAGSFIGVNNVSKYYGKTIIFVQVKDLVQIGAVNYRYGEVNDP